MDSYMYVSTWVTTHWSDCSACWTGIHVFKNTVEDVFLSDSKPGVTYGNAGGHLQHHVGKKYSYNMWA